MQRYSGPACRICATPFSSEHAHICGDCLKKPPPFSRAVCFGLYDGVLATAINHFKFQRIRRLYKPLGRLLLDLDFKKVDAIVPVPLSVAGLRDRGFNQSLLLAKFISDKTDIPLIADGLFKNVETHPQIGLPARDRISNLKGVFSTNRYFKDMSLMLIDDVMTTGATARECAKQLMKAGAGEVVVIALARARSD
jgi:ComF family protein